LSRAQFVDTNGKIYSADSCASLRKAWKNGEIDLYTLARGSYPGKQLEADEIAGISSIGYWDAGKAQNWGLDWHKNEGIEICLLESGTLGFQMGKDQYGLKPRDLTFTRPWLSHRLGNPLVGACKLHWLILDVGVRYPHQDWVWPDWIILNDSDLDELTKILRQNEQAVWRSSQEIFDCFLQISKIVKKSDEGPYDTKLKIFVNALLSYILDLFRMGNVQLNTALIETKRTVELFLRELNDSLLEDWTLKSMADHCNLGITQFSKYCKEITNCSPSTYLNALRLKKASDLLSNRRGLSITEVAFRAGFSSPQYFTSSFKKQYGLAPQAYRDRRLKAIR